MMSGKGKSRCGCGSENLPSFVAEAIDELGGMEKISASIPSKRVLSNQEKVYKALSNHTRLTILWSMRCCEMCPCVLKEFLKVGDSTLSYHLDMLEKAGLIKGRPEKNWRIFALTPKGRKVLQVATEE
jgi:ArsR family transcriptional regulator